MVKMHDGALAQGFFQAYGWSSQMSSKLGQSVSSFYARMLLTAFSVTSVTFWKIFPELLIKWIIDTEEK